MGFDKLWDILVECWDRATPVEILLAYQGGVRLRGGKYRDTVGPGVWFKIPFYDQILSHNIVTRTKNISAKPLETSDGVTVQVSAILRFSISNVKKALLEVEGVEDATQDISCLVIADVVQRSKYEEVRSAAFAEKLTAAGRKRGWRYGIEVEELGLDSVSRMPIVLLTPNSLGHG